RLFRNEDRATRQNLWRTIEPEQLANASALAVGICDGDPIACGAVQCSTCLMQVIVEILAWAIQHSGSKGHCAHDVHSRIERRDVHAVARLETDVASVG